MTTHTEHTPMPLPQRVALLIALLSLPFTALAQPAPTPTAAPGFDQIDSCTQLATRLEEVRTQSAPLDEVLASPASDTEALLKAIFTGTHTMLAFGESMFRATSEHEDACKSALRDAEKTEEIIRIYDLLLEPTLRGHAFLRRVRDSARALNDDATADDMETSMKSYSSAMLQLVGFCEADLPKVDDAAEDAPSLCADFRKKVELALE